MKKTLIHTYGLKMLTTLICMIMLSEYVYDKINIRLNNRKKHQIIVKKTTIITTTSINLTTTTNISLFTKKRDNKNIIPLKRSVNIDTIDNTINLDTHVVNLKNNSKTIDTVVKQKRQYKIGMRY
jgi:hypothetical protein